MKYCVIALRDKVSQNFEGITIEINIGVAKRNFSFSVNNSAELQFKSKDLELYHIGYLESASGVYEPVVPMVRICSGDEVMING